MWSPVTRGLTLCFWVVCLHWAWIEFVVSHGVGLIPLALIHFIRPTTGLKTPQLLNCWRKQVRHTLAHFLCAQQQHTGRVSRSLCFPQTLFCSLPRGLRGNKVAFIANKHLAPCYLSRTHYPRHMIYTLTLFCWFYYVFLLHVQTHLLLCSEHRLTAWFHTLNTS